MGAMTAPRRQARGLARIEGILDGAASLLGEGGIEAVAMNAVARRAGISPGSLYQYFSDREELLAALARRYAERLAAVAPPTATDAVVRDGDLTAVIDAVLDPMLDYTLRNPESRALVVGGDGGLERIVEPVRQAVTERLVALVAARAPQLSGAETRRVAQMCDRIFSATVPALLDADDAERAALARELRVVLQRYLEPIDRGGPGARRARALTPSNASPSRRRRASGG